MAKKKPDAESARMHGGSLFSLGASYQNTYFNLQNRSPSKKLMPAFVRCLQDMSHCNIDYPSRTLTEIADCILEYAKHSPDLPCRSNDVTAWQTIMHPVREKMMDQLRRMIVITPPDHPVIAQLASLKLKDEQKVMGQEIVKCLEIGAFPAAVVMSWCLTLEFLRRWIFRHHLAAFNAVVSAHPFNQAPVNDFEDFFVLPEKTILRAGHDAGLWNKNKQTILMHGLEDRNLFAHPTHTHCTLSGAAAYLERLIKEILLSRPFRNR